ncbi:conserved Plasmodium protein, unknown function [Plasmodium ovale wallikeri]|uniref:Pv-fam-g protein n=2 Tax=Plasmodium ovale TaxID=36330 RepID=A0A1A8ZG20_PLAOA|nr:conserved Plasmodium protein, unknown function [Plasmodium ovale wallikeri]SBT43238.1 conserved Plasmodium protein, unknown function [Plasmodium ovale wallikeri]SBT78388.1 conserved Plasmodium protein, unknown function [Plasmodium ovale]
MDNLHYYVMLQNNTIQPIIVRQPSAIIIHSQPKMPITLDLPPQNIILKNDEPQPIIVRQQNPNIIIQNPQSEFYGNTNFAMGDHNKCNEVGFNVINSANMTEQKINENVNSLDAIQQIDRIDSPYIYTNHNFAYENKRMPMNNMYFSNVALNKENNYSPYSTVLYANKNTD